MKHTLYTLFVLLAFLAGCSDDDASAPSAGRLTLRVPVEWIPDANGEHEGVKARAGDPGVDDLCPKPANIYVFSWLKKNAASYEFYFAKEENLTDTDWELLEPNTARSRYQLRKHIELQLTKPETTGYSVNAQMGRTYAIATNRKLTTEELRAIIGTDYASVLTESKAVNFNAASGAGIDGQLQEATFSTVPAAGESGTAWTTEDFRDLYSSPADHDNAYDDNGIMNGYIVYNNTLYPGVEVVQGAVRLYHVAARMDFQWEVATALWPTTAIKSIEVTNLPTLCRVFRPTGNPATNTTTHPARSYRMDASNPVSPITPGNKWIGRQSFYHLQPADATIDYTVTFEDLIPTDAEPARASKSITFTPPGPVHQVFTGWYRIVATVE